MGLCSFLLDFYFESPLIPIIIIQSCAKKQKEILGEIHFSVIMKQSGKLIRQPVDFPQRGKSTYSSARSPYLLVKLAFRARSPPDGFPTSLPDFQLNCHGSEDAPYLREQFLKSENILK